MDTNHTMPSPKELARYAREKTIPISLRVKESTHAVFNNYAKQYDVTVGSLINELLDKYAFQYGGQLSGVVDINDAILDDYINKKAVKLTKDKDSELVTRIFQTGLLVNYNENSLGYLIDNIKTLSTGKVTKDLRPPKINLKDCFNTTIIASSDKKAIFSATIEPKYGNSYKLEVPADRWILTSAILSSYTKKFIILYGCTDPHRTFLINEKTLKAVEDILNRYKNKSAIAKSIAKQLSDFKESDD